MKRAAACYLCLVLMFAVAAIIMGYAFVVQDRQLIEMKNLSEKDLASVVIIFLRLYIEGDKAAAMAIWETIPSQQQDYAQRELKTFLDSEREKMLKVN
jgi:hypothetical protein